MTTTQHTNDFFFHEWLDDLTLRMNSNPENAELQQAACRSLQHCIEESPSVCDLIGDHLNEDSPKWPVHVSVLAALHIHKDDIYVFQAACTTLSYMAVNSKNLQRELMSKGAYIPIVDEMRSWPGKSDIQLPACEALRALCFNDKNFEEMIVNYEVVPILQHTLHTCCDVDTLNECLLLFISLLDLECVREQCLSQVSLFSFDY